MAPSSRKNASKRPLKRLARQDNSGFRSEKTRKPASNPDQTSAISIYGIHAAAAALQNPARKIHAIFATKNASQRLGDAIRAAGIAVTIVEPAKIDAKLPRDAVHQGILVEAGALPQTDLADLPGNGPIILLDQVTDPQNVGSIMRSACAFGAEALVVTARNAPRPSGALAKAASGTLEHLPFITVTNLARTLDQLNKANYQTIGLAGEAENYLGDVVDTGSNARPTALVMGAEGKGIRTLTARTCCDLAKFELDGPITTLNVSNAAAVALQIITQLGRP